MYVLRVASFLLTFFIPGLIAGGAADPRYNLTYIVQTSKENGQPIIGVSINYRLHGLQSRSFISS